MSWNLQPTANIFVTLRRARAQLAPPLLASEHAQLRRAPQQHLLQASVRYFKLFASKLPFGSGETEAAAEGWGEW